MAQSSPHLWLIFCFWRIIMNPRFIKSYITSQKCLWITLKHAQTLLRRNHTSPLVIGCRQTRHPSCRQLPHAQTFMQSVPYASHLNVYSLTNLTHFQSTIVEYDVVDFIDYFLRSHLFWTARTLSITCTNTAATKFSEPFMNNAMRWSRLLIIFCELFYVLTVLNVHWTMENIFLSKLND